MAMAVVICIKAGWLARQFSYLGREAMLFSAAGAHVAQLEAANAASPEPSPHGKGFDGFDGFGCPGLEFHGDSAERLRGRREGVKV